MPDIGVAKLIDGNLLALAIGVANSLGLGVYGLCSHLGSDGFFIVEVRLSILDIFEGIELFESFLTYLSRVDFMSLKV